MNATLVIIDPQVDFMPGGALGIDGADNDMKRLAAMIDRVGKKLDGIQVTLDSHRLIDIAHPGLWKNENGDSPAPFTIISVDDIKAGIWTPRNANAKMQILEGKTLGQYVLSYVEELAAQGNYPLIIWPEHCLIGTPGHAVQADLMASLQNWERREFANVDYVTKGVNAFTEHYGALMAEVPMATDPSTSLNTDFLDILAQADIVGVGGEASSHCVMASVNQIVDNIGEDQIQKFWLLTDCMSPVAQIGDGPDFPAIAEQWMKDMEARGMHLTTSDKFLA